MTHLPRKWLHVLFTGGNIYSMHVLCYSCVRVCWIWSDPQRKSDESLYALGQIFQDDVFLKLQLGGENVYALPMGRWGIHKYRLTNSQWTIFEKKETFSIYIHLGFLSKNVYGVQWVQQNIYSILYVRIKVTYLLIFLFNGVKWSLFSL